MCSSLGSSDSVAGHLVTFKFYKILLKKKKKKIIMIVIFTCLFIQAAVVGKASRLFLKGLRECFEKDYERLFDVPQHIRTDNDVSVPSPIYIPAAG